MNKLSALIMGIALLLCQNVWAEELKVAITLQEVTVQNTSEKHGDEIYFSITQYSNQNSSEQFRVPMFPTHWLSKHLDKIKDVNLWDNVLQADEAIQVIISLTEHDSPPWNLDDHIGSVKATLVNNAGELQVTWSIPNFHDQTEVTQLEGPSPLFILKGAGSQYKVTFQVEILES